MNPTNQNSALSDLLPIINGILPPQQKLHRLEKVGRSSWRGEGSFGFALFKLDTPTASTKHTLGQWIRSRFRSLNGGSLSFINEERVQSQLTSEDRTKIQTPDLMEYSTKEILVMEWVEDTSRPNLLVSVDGLPTLLGRLASLNLDLNHKWVQQLQIDLLQNPLRQTLLRIFKNCPSQIGRWKAFALGLQILILYITTPRLPMRILLHNDLNPSNILVHISSGQVYMIDLEDVYYENKMVLNDIIDSAFDWKNLTLVKSKICEYQSEVEALQAYDIPIDLWKQLQFAMIRNVTRWLGSKEPSNAQKRSLAQFLTTTVLNKNRFKVWLKEQ